MKNLLLTSLLLVFCISAIYAQRKASIKKNWDTGLFLGIATYQGDLAKENFPIQESNFALGLIARTSLRETFGLRAGVIFSRLSGEDPWVQRNYSFRTSILELSVLGEYEPLENKRLLRGGKKKFFVSPYAFGGPALAFVTPQALFPEGYKVGDRSPIEQDKINGDSRTQLALPLGVGVKLDFHKKFYLQGETGVRLPFTDYLDGVSMTANPDKGDLYWFSGVTIFFSMK